MINIIKKLFGFSKIQNPKSSEKVVTEKNVINKVEKPKEDIIWSDSNHGKFTDARDKNVYNVIKIGNQIWLADNFRFKSSNGCWAYDNNEFRAKTYGYLYNWDTAKQISPNGWHLPSDEEWITLINFFGGKSIAGKKLKSTTEGNGTNESGFNALLAGCREPFNYTFCSFGEYAFFWTSTSNGSQGIIYRGLVYNTSEVGRESDDKNLAFSVRLIKD